MRPAQPATVSCSWPVEGLTSAPSPRGRMKTTVTSSGRHSVSSSGTWTLPPLLSPLIAQRPAGVTNVHVSFHHVHTPYTCAHTYMCTPPTRIPHTCAHPTSVHTCTPPHAHTPTCAHTPHPTRTPHSHRPHAPGNLSQSAQGVSHTRARLNASVVADGSRPGPVALREEGHLLLIYTKTLAYSPWLWPQPRKNPPSAGLSRLSELWIPSPPPALPTGSPCPMWGPLLCTGLGSSALPSQAPLSLIAWTSLSLFTHCPPHACLAPAWARPGAWGWRCKGDEVKLMICGHQPPTCPWSHTVSRAMVGASLGAAGAQIGDL